MWFTHTVRAHTHTQTSWRLLRGEIRLRQLEAPSALSFTTPLCVTSKYQPRFVSKCHRATGLCPDLIAWILIILYFCWYAYGKQQQNKKKLSLDFVFFFLWTRAVIIHDKGLIGLFAVRNHLKSETFYKETRFKFFSPTVQFYIQFLSWPSTFPWAGIGLIFVSIFPFWRVHCCAACWNSKRTGLFPPAKMDKDLSPTVPFTPAGSQSAGTARCCFVTEWEMILIKNRINKLWASLLSQSLEPCILESGAKSIPGASAASYIFPLVKCKSKALEL